MTECAPGPAADAIEAAGTLLWRHDAGGRLLVALVHRPRYDDWSLPKGKLIAGEHRAAAAVRETAEETGSDAVLGRPLPTDQYLACGVPKVVHYWAAHARGGTFRPNAEVDATVWFTPAEAARWLTRPNDVAILTAFLAGPPRTQPLIMLRHGHALPRKEWKADDCGRPLDPDGTQQALDLVAVLRAFGPTRVLSSPARRCRDTVVPFALAQGLKVEEVPGLAEGVSDAEFADAAATVTTAADAEPIVVCSHRPLLPRLFRVLERTGHGCVPQKALQPGEFMIFHRAGPVLAAIERHHP